MIQQLFCYAIAAVVAKCKEYLTIYSRKNMKFVTYGKVCKNR